MSGRLQSRRRPWQSCSWPSLHHAASAAAPPVTIAIANFTFDPPALTVPAGTEVTWVNQDDNPHLVRPPTRSGSPPLDTDDRFTLRLTEPGTISYFCGLHPHMTGTVTVVASPAPS